MSTIQAAAHALSHCMPAQTSPARLGVKHASEQKSIRATLPQLSVNQQHNSH